MDKNFGHSPKRRRLGGFSLTLFSHYEKKGNWVNDCSIGFDSRFRNPTQVVKSDPALYVAIRRGDRGI